MPDLVGGSGLVGQKINRLDPITVSPAIYGSGFTLIKFSLTSKLTAFHLVGQGLDESQHLGFVCEISGVIMTLLENDILLLFDSEANWEECVFSVCRVSNDENLDFLGIQVS